MRSLILSLALSMISSSNSCIADNLPTAVPPGPVHVVTTEPRVVPPGTPLVVRANDVVQTRTSHRATIYDASVAEDVLDQNGELLIPKDSPVEMIVRAINYLGPGGVGATGLLLDIEAVTIGGLRYPVETKRDKTHSNPDNKRAKSSEAVTVGSVIDVPANTRLVFQIEDPIRLRTNRR